MDKGTKSSVANPTSGGANGGAAVNRRGRVLKDAWSSAIKADSSLASCVGPQVFQVISMNDKKIFDYNHRGISALLFSSACIRTNKSAVIKSNRRQARENKDVGH